MAQSVGVLAERTCIDEGMRAIGTALRSVLRLHTQIVN